MDWVTDNKSGIDDPGVKSRSSCWCLCTDLAGLSGIGDLIVTCTSMHSRNRAGILIGKGSQRRALTQIGMVVEGVKTCKAAYELAQSLNVEMPITEQLYRILYEGKEAAAAVNELMLRDKTHESEKLEIM